MPHDRDQTDVPRIEHALEDPLWVDGRRLAQQFDLSTAQLSKRLVDLGLKKSTQPTQKAIDMGMARFAPEIRRRSNPKVQWHLGRVGAAFEQTGLIKLDDFAVFCRINIDLARDGLRLVDDEHSPQSAHQWFITHQIWLQLDCVPGGRRDEFIDALVDGLVNPARGRPTSVNLVHAMLDVVGYLGAHLARMSSRKLKQDTGKTTETGSISRL